MIKNILFDFDGVIIDSMHVRDEGFRYILKKFDKKLVDQFIVFHRKNAGLSRYFKIRFFYENFLNEEIQDEEILKYADEFSKIMKKELTDKKYLINETVKFIKKNFVNLNFHIVSGSDEKELNFLCKKLNISKYFKTIEGSPTPKIQLVKNIMQKYNYKANETILIGDSINDFDAAKYNNIYFVGYNNPELKYISDLYIDEVNEKILTYKFKHNE